MVRTHTAPPQPALARELSLAAKSVRAWADDRFVQHGYNLTTWILLQHVAAPDQPPSQRELAASLSIGGATLVRHLDRLEAEGLLRRDPDARDRRVARISLTDAGHTRYDQLADIAASVDRELRDLLSEREEKVLRTTLARLRAHTTPTPAPTTESDAE